MRTKGQKVVSAIHLSQCSTPLNSSLIRVSYPRPHGYVHFSGGFLESWRWSKPTLFWRCPARARGQDLWKRRSFRPKLGQRWWRTWTSTPWRSAWIIFEPFCCTEAAFLLVVAMVAVVMLGFEPRVLHIPGKYSTTNLYPQTELSFF